MALRTLQDLFLHEVKDLYDAEHQLTKALPLMAKGVSDPELKAAFEDHLKQTKEHVKRLEKVFKTLDKEPTRKTCLAMQGLMTEAHEMLEEEASAVVKDAGLISSAQRVEHYEMAGYGTARTFAYLLGNQEAAALLQTTLDEEEATDKKLTQLANNINVAALG